MSRIPHRKVKICKNTDPEHCYTPRLELPRMCRWLGPFRGTEQALKVIRWRPSLEWTIKLYLKNCPLITEVTLEVIHLIFLTKEVLKDTGYLSVDGPESRYGKRWKLSIKISMAKFTLEHKYCWTMDGQKWTFQRTMEDYQLCHQGIRKHVRI